MTISSALRAIYSNEVDLDYWSGLVLSHSQAGTLYLSNAVEAQTGIVDDTACTFEPVPFVFVLPDRDAAGQQDMRLQICAIGAEVNTLCAAAIADPTERVRCRFGTWIYGDPIQQDPPLLDLSLTAIVLNSAGVSCTATRSDILNRSIPARRYTVAEFPGLDRR